METKDTVSDALCDDCQIKFRRRKKSKKEILVRELATYGVTLCITWPLKTVIKHNTLKA